MYCDRCGTQLLPAQSFCSTCGKAAHPVPLMPQESRIAGHIRLLGIFWLALSAFRLIPAVVLGTVFCCGAHFLPPDVPDFVPFLMIVLSRIFLIVAVLGFATGWGLLNRKPWARMLAIVFGCFSLLDMPFGTALGIYTLWVLLPAQSEAEYRKIAQAA
jgi:hypothetical protein